MMAQASRGKTRPTEQKTAGAFPQTDFSALASSSATAMKGAEELTREASEYARKSLEDASAMIQNLAAARSPVDLLRLQSEFARSALENAVSYSTKVSETVIRLTGEFPARTERG